jgi:protein gp37
MKINIDPTIRTYLPQLDPGTLAGLKTNIKLFGCRDPLVVWKETSILLDGHHRYQICRDLNVPFTIIQMSFQELESALCWIDGNQLQKRNLTPEAIAYYRGQLYTRLKKRQGGDHKSKGHSDPLINQAEQLANEYGVSEKTIKRDAAYAQAVDALEEIEPGVKAKALNGAMTKKEVIDRARKRAPKKTPKPAQPRPIKTIKEFYTVGEFKKLSASLQEKLLATQPTGNFNQQNNDSIEWAKWSWNPITGCKHNCPYCYARDIAERFYSQKFEPSIYPARLNQPLTLEPPEKSKTEVGYKNVFVCSMADLFGRWVPSAWIEKVVQTCADAPAWNFLFLTKFPSRLAEISFPDNAWVGTTVDCQARVKEAEKAFRKVKAKVKWLSCEPLIEPLRFTSLNMFDWIVVGGASRSTQTPEYVPPAAWIGALYVEASRCGLKVYEKTNGRPREYPGEARRATPEAMKYLPVI